MAARGPIRRITLAALAGAIALAGAACGVNSQAVPAATTAGSELTIRPGAAFRVGLVAGVGGPKELAYRALGGQGLRRAARELGVEATIVTAHTRAEAARRLAELAGHGYDLVLASGAAPVTAVDAVAQRYPRVHFALVDVSRESLPPRPRNVSGLRFAEQEAGYLAGYLAGLVSRAAAGSQQAVGSVGGRSTPAVDRYLGGFQAGARAADDKIALLNAYAGGFRDPAKCKELALDEITQGAGAIFAVAGHCGTGALVAARERSVWGIGVDVDASSRGGHILTSAVKRIDVAVFLTVEAVRDGRFAGGRDVVFGVASGGVGLGAISRQVPADLVARVKRVQDALAAGRISDIPTAPIADHRRIRPQ